ncbi:hypothetical protein Golax_021346 [Gossypium laxum]|uniref:Uncharacterized protein n=4 Tax=Gossypium TaxID=3633 RepID=A0A7J9K2J5_9ROSI|nr:hypothetical protein [Gossypium lobatum]MBA0695941.1 hypothetical protein [Gossypium aridum]MBA0724672.1 hypothetical protein [Gossypium laxum]MBA0840670.1 hypothetical protein [Gossypium armourianum]
MQIISILFLQRQLIFLISCCGTIIRTG